MKKFGPDFYSITDLLTDEEFDKITFIYGDIIHFRTMNNMFKEYKPNDLITIKLSNGEPANFLDVGGVANAETVAHGFKIILSDSNVKSILINIFGGIVRCDRVAQGVIDALSQVEVDVPVIIRLEGTNAEAPAGSNPNISICCATPLILVATSSP